MQYATYAGDGVMRCDSKTTSESVRHYAIARLTAYLRICNSDDMPHHGPPMTCCLRFLPVCRWLYIFGGNGTRTIFDSIFFSIQSWIGSRVCMHSRQSDRSIQSVDEHRLARKEASAWTGARELGNHSLHGDRFLARSLAYPFPAGRTEHLLYRPVERRSLRERTRRRLGRPEDAEESGRLRGAGDEEGRGHGGMSEPETTAGITSGDRNPAEREL